MAITKRFCILTALSVWILLILFSAGCGTTKIEDHSKHEKALIPLIAESEEGDTDAVKALIANGADVNTKDKDGVTALMEAVFKGHLSIVKILVDAGADVNAKSRRDMTALIIASIRGFTGVVKILVDAGADMNAMDENGMTALMHAKGKPEIEEILKKAGAK